MGPGRHNLGQSVSWEEHGYCDSGEVEYEPDQEHVSRALKVLGLTDARGVANPGTDDVVGGLEASEISELRRTSKWREPPEDIKEEGDLSHWRRTEAVPDRSGPVQLPLPWTGQTSCTQ